MFTLAKKLNKIETIINEENKTKITTMLLDIITLNKS